MICKNIVLYFLLSTIILTNSTADNSIEQKNETITQEYKTKIVSLSPEERAFLIKTKLNCVISSDWNPFNFKENGKLVGISLDYWNLIKKKTLIDSDCKEVSSFDKAVNLIKNKKADVTLSIAVSEDKVEYGLFLSLMLHIQLL